MQHIRRLLLLTALLTISVLSGYRASLAQDATQEPADAASADQIARGEYIVRVAAACVDCHADKEIYAAIDDPLTVELKGGAAFEYEPFGAVYAPNLTTLHDWSDEGIENAIRYGVRPDGTVLLPPMPYEAYARMSDTDMAAVIAYLRTLEPIENEIPEAELLDNLTREDVRAVPEIVDAEHPSLPEDATPAERGAYLGIAVSACVQCHGALDAEGQLDLDAPLYADRVLNTAFGEQTVPALTQRDLQDWTDEELIAYFHGERPDGQPIFFMPVYAYQYLTEQDKADLVAWLRSQP